MEETKSFFPISFSFEKNPEESIQKLNFRMKRQKLHFYLQKKK